MIPAPWDALAFTALQLLPSFVAWAVACWTYLRRSRLAGDKDTGKARTRHISSTTYQYLFIKVLNPTIGHFPGQVASLAMVMAIGVTADGGREVLGFAIGRLDDGEFLSTLLEELTTVRTGEAG